MMKPKPDENVIVGSWVFKENVMTADENCKRIEWLTQTFLTKINSVDGGWTTNYQDPDDGRYWQKTFPQSEMHGGGPPTLQCINSVET